MIPGIVGLCSMYYLPFVDGKSLEEGQPSQQVNCLCRTMLSKSNILKYEFDLLIRAEHVIVFIKKIKKIFWDN